MEKIKYYRTTRSITISKKVKVIEIFPGFYLQEINRKVSYIWNPNKRINMNTGR